MLRIFFLLAASGLLPQRLLAQSHSFQDGSYVLMNSAVRQPAQVKLRSDYALLAKDKSGKVLDLSPNEVAEVRIGSHKFISIGGPGVLKEWSNDRLNRVFAEQLDSGQVELLRYQTLGNPTVSMVGAGGGFGPVSGGGGRISVFILRRGELLKAPRDNKKFREDMLPFLQGRPDIMALMDDKRVLAEDLPLVVRALNSGQPMPPMPSYLNRE